MVLKVGKEGIYYNEMGLMTYKKILYSISHTEMDVYSNWIPVIMHYTESTFLTCTKTQGGWRMGMTLVEGGGVRESVFILNGTKHNLGILHSLRRIQRAMRRVLQKRRLVRFTALAMGLHPRLGERSVVGGLCADILDIITL
jgi:hypothetical protein